MHERGTTRRVMTGKHAQLSFRNCSRFASLMAPNSIASGGVGVSDAIICDYTEKRLKVLPVVQFSLASVRQEAATAGRCVAGK